MKTDFPTFKVFSKFKKYLVAKHGATAIEYSLIAAGIALAIVAIVFLLGGDVSGLFNTLQTTLASYL